MNGQPAYFEAIRRKAAGRWDQLEQDPDLAGPWHQLFKQVQSPRHILSELLQNADDAGATEASVRIEIKFSSSSTMERILRKRTLHPSAGLGTPTREPCTPSVSVELASRAPLALAIASNFSHHLLRLVFIGSVLPNRNGCLRDRIRVARRASRLR